MRGTFATFLLLTSLGCGTTNTAQFVPAAQTACQTNQAQIGVADGYVQALCGCQEGQGQPVQGGLTCTVTAGTQVFFLYLSTHARHQIAGVNNSFPASPLSDPGDGSQLPSVQSYPFVFATAGNFPFDDLYNNALSGTIIVH